MPRKYGSLTALLNILSSGKLALVLVLLVILFSLAGVVLPQVGTKVDAEIVSWQQEHPIITSVLEPLGLFHVFHSRVFLGTIFLLGINTLTCTVLHFLRERTLTTSKRHSSVERLGFYLLHISLIVIMAGGFLSVGARMSGNIVITEGQRIKEALGSYQCFVQGPLRQWQHKGFTVSLTKVESTYLQGKYQTDISSQLEFYRGDEKVADGVVRINFPLEFEGLTYTLDKTGFSPRISIRKAKGRNQLMNSFVALQTFDTPQGKEYHDFLPLPFFKNKVYMTLYPAHARKADGPVKIGDEPENPLIVVEMEDDSGKIVRTADMILGGGVTMGEYTFGFEDLRRWASFLVCNDPGYPVMCVAFWLSLAAILLRYGPDLWKWFGEKDREVQGCDNDAV